MSNHLSLAQVLPVDVLRSILKWVIFERRSPLHGNSCDLSHLKELLSVSSTWRQVALECLWRQLELNVEIMTNKVNLSRPKWVKNNMLPHNATNLVREIHVSFPMPDIVSGVAHKLLLDYIGDVKCFPLVNNLVIKVDHYKDRIPVLTDVPTAKALEFAKLLKSLAPVATTVHVICCDFDRGTDYESGSDDDSLQTIADNGDIGRSSKEGVLEELVDVIYSGTKHADLTMYEVGVKDLSTIDHMPPLTRLTLYGTELSTVYASLVHKSASTLQYLDIKISKAYMLVFDANEEVVLYPNLQHLSLDRCVRSGSYAKAIPTGTICFPVLRSLWLNEPYPFHDNILFRGNTETLEYLHFILDNEAIVKLHQWRVFENKHKVLQHVFFHVDNYDRNASLAIESNRNMFLSNLISGIKSVSVFDIKPLMACITTVRYGHGFQSITVLDIRLDRISFFDVLSILKVLPVLARLRCNICGLGTELENIATEELPDHIVSTYCNVGKSMQVWTMTKYNGREDISEIINYILLVALVCPKLWRVELISKRFQDTRAKIVDALNIKPYSKHAHRLSKIIDAVREYGN